MPLTPEEKERLSDRVVQVIRSPNPHGALDELRAKVAVGDEGDDGMNSAVLAIATAISASGHPRLAPVRLVLESRSHVAPWTIGLIGSPEDEQIRRVASALAARRTRVVSLDLTDIPAYVRFHWQGDSLRFGDVDLSSLDAALARTAHFAQPIGVLGSAADPSHDPTLWQRETGALQNAIVSELDGRIPVINPPATYRYHRQKPFMYQALRRAGVDVPEFAVGCDLEQAAYFVDAHGGETVAKPLMGGEVVVADLDYLREHHAEFDRRPILLQRRVRGRSLRGYVVEGRVVGLAEIVHGDVVDWRTDVRAVRAVAADARVAQALVRAAEALGLIFAAVDVEEEGGAGGLPWVLDVNPSPMFAGFEKLSGIEIADPLADCLLRRAQAHRGESGRL